MWVSNMEASKSLPELALEQKILNAPEDDYMNAEQLAFFKQRLIDLHDETRAHIREAKAQMLNKPDVTDLSDKATWEEQCSLLIRIVEREQRLLPKIQQSLERIRLDTYGYCEESGEPIGIPRLLARPTTEYCVDVKAVLEMKEHLRQE